MEWTIQDLGALGEFVGAFAVVATLFYLVVQVRQSKKATEANTRAIRGNAAWDAENVFAQRNLGVARDPKHAELVQRVFAPDTEVNTLNEMDRMRAFADTTSILQMVQAQYFLWREGSLPEEIWSYRSVWARRYITLPVVQAVWQDLKTERYLTQVFVYAIEAIPPSTVATLSIGSKATT